MTVHVEPSNQRGVANHDVLSIASRWGSGNWIVPSGVDVQAGRAGMAGAPLNGAAITTSGLDVSIDTFEAFIGGAWLASDDASHAEHTHTLAGAATRTTLYLGYDLSAADTIIFGPDSEFSAEDPKVPIGAFDDDGTAVTNVWDRRPLGPTPNMGIPLAVDIQAGVEGDTGGKLDVDTGTLDTPFHEYRVQVFRQSHDDGLETYKRIRVNGIDSDSYEYDVIAMGGNKISTVEGTEWSHIAGTDLESGEGNDHAGWALQTVAIRLPPLTFSDHVHDRFPLMEVVEKGVTEGVKVPIVGQLKTELPNHEITRVRCFGCDTGDSETGWAAIYGVGHRPPI